MTSNIQTGTLALSYCYQLSFKRISAPWLASRSTQTILWDIAEDMLTFLDTKYGPVSNAVNVFGFISQKKSTFFFKSPWHTNVLDQDNVRIPLIRNFKVTRQKVWRHTGILGQLLSWSVVKHFFFWGFMAVSVLSVASLPPSAIASWTSLSLGLQSFIKSCYYQKYKNHPPHISCTTVQLHGAEYF